MDLAHARYLAQLARAAYLPEPDLGLPAGRPFRIDEFATRAFRGLALSDDENAYLVFRGTKGGLGEPTERQVAAWLVNLDFMQTEVDGYRVHRGFASEVERALDDLELLARRHGAGRRRLWVTGHSAGGALAVLSARRLRERGLPVAGALVFSAPRVGDRAFAASYPVPLWRVETRHDIVPHLPLPPRVASLVGRYLVDPLLERAARQYGGVEALACKVTGTEYVHAGELAYDDGQAALYRVPPGDFWRRYGPILGAELRADIARGRAPSASAYAMARCPGWATPVPARLLDTVRFSTTLREVMSQLRGGRRDFLLDHRVDRAVSFLDRSALPLGAR